MHVPGWHEATRRWQEEGRLQVLGILEEQHPDRARLFMQWKRMQWPLLMDPLDLLRVPYVPITLAIDEYGIIRLAEIGVDDADRLDREFLSRNFDPPASETEVSAPAPAGAADLDALREAAVQAGGAPSWRTYAQALLQWGGPDRIDDVIDAYRSAITADPRDDPTQFRLGVTYRMRYDSPRRQPGDFQKAVDQWASALKLDPNNYIWRRRIQQYGPRLDKPYSFYDWVSEARHDIEARGETPVSIGVEPGAAELAYPTEHFAAADRPAESPDPRSLVARDREGFITVETVLVPPAVAAGESARAHVIFRPNAAIKAHWNNEVDDLVLWVDAPTGWHMDERRLTAPRPGKVVSTETRVVEFEVEAPKDAPPGTVDLPAYALYYVCEDVKGTCLFRRQDIQLSIPITGG